MYCGDIESDLSAFNVTLTALPLFAKLMIDNSLSYFCSINAPYFSVSLGKTLDITAFVRTNSVLSIASKQLPAYFPSATNTPHEASVTTPFASIIPVIGSVVLYFIVFRSTG